MTPIGMRSHQFTHSSTVLEYTDPRVIKPRNNQFVTKILRDGHTNISFRYISEHTHNAMHADLTFAHRVGLVTVIAPTEGQSEATPTSR
jgi:hypothetical protein